MICGQTSCYQTGLQTAGEQPRLTGPAVTQLSSTRPNLGEKVLSPGPNDGQAAAGSPGEAPDRQWPKTNLLKAEESRLQPGTTS